MMSSMFQFQNYRGCYNFTNNSNTRRINVYYLFHKDGNGSATYGGRLYRSLFKKTNKPKNNKNKKKPAGVIYNEMFCIYPLTCSVYEL